MFTNAYDIKLTTMYRKRLFSCTPVRSYELWKYYSKMRPMYIVITASLPGLIHTNHFWIMLH